MGRIYLLLINIACWINIGNAQTPYNQDLVHQSVKDSIRNELDIMDQRDQQFRWQIMFGELNSNRLDSLQKLPDSIKIKIFRKMHTPAYGLTVVQFDSLNALQDALDKKNQQSICEIFEKYGWPGKKLVGNKAFIPSIMMLHFPDSIKLKLYPQLIQEIRRGNIDAESVARMYDKYLIEKGRPQLYGTFEGSAHAVKNLNETNKARRRLGLNELKKSN